METCDYIVGVDDLIPEKFAWVREPDGVATWYLEERAEQSVHPTAFGVCPHGVNLGNQVCSACEPEKFGGG
jgi:hypothetical protein